MTRKKEDREFQIALLATQIDLEIIFGTLIALLAIEYSIYYLVEFPLQVALMIAMSVTFLSFPLSLDRARDRRFKRLREKYVEPLERKKEKKEG